MLGYICSPARPVTSIHTKPVCREIGSRLDSLQRLTLDNATQQDRLGSLKLPIGAKLAELKETIDLRSPGLLGCSFAQRPPAGGKLIPVLPAVVRTLSEKLHQNFTHPSAT
jgi:hypothetical protein